MWLFCNSLLELVHIECPSIKILIDYLTDISKIMSKLDLPIIWRLPTGLTVTQKYLKLKKKAIRPYTKIV